VREAIFVGQGLGSAIRQGDQPKVSLGLESQALCSPGNADIIETMVDSDVSSALHLASERQRRRKRGRFGGG
jgi:hypothetical protein